MTPEPQSHWRRAAFGVACVACCTVPMLVVAGALSLGAFAFGGVAMGSVAVVALSALAIHRRWIAPDRRRTKLGEPPL